MRCKLETVFQSLMPDYIMPSKIFIKPTSNVPPKKTVKHHKKAKGRRSRRLVTLGIALAEAAAEPEGRGANTKVHRISGTIAVELRKLLSAGEKR